MTPARLESGDRIGPAGVALTSSCTREMEFRKCGRTRLESGDRVNTSGRRAPPFLARHLKHFTTGGNDG